jgi:hypothetical protein
VPTVHAIRTGGGRVGSYLRRARGRSNAAADSDTLHLAADATFESVLKGELKIIKPRESKRGSTAADGHCAKSGGHRILYAFYDFLRRLLRFLRRLLRCIFCHAHAVTGSAQTRLGQGPAAGVEGSLGCPRSIAGYFR